MITEIDVRSLLKLKDEDTVQIKKVADNRYRVNIYNTTFIDESVIPRTRLMSSHYLCNRSGTLKDITI